MNIAKNPALALRIALCLLSSSPLAAQTATGTILGHLTDSSGAVLTGVEVTAVNPEKGLSSKTVSDEQGIYHLFYLAPATYNLIFEKPGFAKLDREGVALRSNDTLTIDLQMNVGNVVEKVDVQGVPPMLETATSTTGTVLSANSC